MKTIVAKIQRFVRSEEAPTATEYAVMLALIIVVALVAIQTLGQNVSTTFSNTATKLNSTGGGS